MERLCLNFSLNDTEYEHHFVFNCDRLKFTEPKMRITKLRFFYKMIYFATVNINLMKFVLLL